MNWPAELPTPKAILFDLDGVIVDSTRAHATAWTALFAEEGIRFSFEDYQAQAAGLPRDAVIRSVLGERSDHQRLMARKLELMQVEELPLIPGTIDFVQRLTLPYAVATSSRVPGLLLGGAGVVELFPVVVHSGQVAHGKPATDVFLEAARQLGVPPEHALVVEDAPAGVQAGLAAGCTVVGLGTADLSAAHLVVNRLPLTWLTDWAARSSP